MNDIDFVMVPQTGNRKTEMFKVPLKKLNVFIGPNGVGKTYILKHIFKKIIPCINVDFHRGYSLNPVHMNLISDNFQSYISVFDKVFPVYTEFDIEDVINNSKICKVLFHLTYLILSRDVKAISIENFGDGLNPKSIWSLMPVLYNLIEKNNKQVFIATHNPIVLDGLDLKNTNIQLRVVELSSEGEIWTHRIFDPQLQPGEPPVRMSQAFLSGLIGGLPSHF